LIILGQFKPSYPGFFVLLAEIKYPFLKHNCVVLGMAVNEEIKNHPMLSRFCFK